MADCDFSQQNLKRGEIGLIFSNFYFTSLAKPVESNNDSTFIAPANSKNGSIARTSPLNK